MSIASFASPMETADSSQVRIDSFNKLTGTGQASTWWRVARVLGVLLVLGLAAALAVMSALFVQRSHDLDDTRVQLRSAQAAAATAEAAECTTPVPADGTVKLSNSTREWILSAMDPSVNPCDDFVAYTCGAWQAANPTTGTTANMRAFNAVAAVTNTDLQAVLNEQFTDAGTASNTQHTHMRTDMLIMLAVAPPPMTAVCCCLHARAHAVCAWCLLFACVSTSKAA